MNPDLGKEQVDFLPRPRAANASISAENDVCVVILLSQLPGQHLISATKSPHPEQKPQNTRYQTPIRRVLASSPSDQSAVMSKSKLPLFLGLAAAGGVGYYFYQAGGDSKVAKKKFESEAEVTINLGS
jgi:hypothetical protein